MTRDATCNWLQRIGYVIPNVVLDRGNYIQNFILFLLLAIITRPMNYGHDFFLINVVFVTLKKIRQRFFKLTITVNYYDCMYNSV